MIRHTLVYIYVFGFGLYAFKDWYKSLCALILMMAAVRHPDMPRTLMGIQGLTPWNILLVFVILGCFCQKKEENLKWDMLGKINILLLLYLIVVLMGFYRMINDTAGIYEYASFLGKQTPTSKYFISEYLINSVKWVIPGLLLFYGCNSKERLVLGLIATAGIYVFLAIQVIRWIPMESIRGGAELARKAAKTLDVEVGMHRVELSIMFGGAFWGVYLLHTLSKRKIVRFISYFSSFSILLALSLTGGRSGYLGWIGTGAVVSYARNKKYLFILPITGLLLVIILPAVSQRMFYGVSKKGQVNIETRDSLEDTYIYHGINLYKVTSGRILVWSKVIKKIAEKPFFGYGRMAMQRTGVASSIWLEYREIFGHPHNAYLQCIFDNGLIGFLPIILFHLLVIKYSWYLLKHAKMPEHIIAGGMALAIVTGFLIGVNGGLSFYPREEAVGRWCSIGLMLRVFINQMKHPEDKDLAIRENANKI